MRCAGMVGRCFLVLLVATCCGAVQAADRSAQLCRLLLAQSGIEVADRELAVEQAGTQQVAADEIFALVDGLWKSQVVERLTYLRARHDKDTTRLSVAREGSALLRARAARDQYLALCGPGEHRSVGEAYRGFLKADCDLNGLDVEIARVDLAFTSEVKESVLDLRRNDVATRQEVIRAERDVKLVEQELAGAQARSQACRAALDVQPGK